MISAVRRARTFLLVAGFAVGSATAAVACDDDNGGGATSSGGPDASGVDSTTPPTDGGGGGTDGSDLDGASGDGSDGASTRSFGAIRVADVDTISFPKLRNLNAQFVTDPTKSTMLPPPLGQCLILPATPPVQTSAGNISAMVDAQAATIGFDGTKYPGNQAAGLWGLEGTTVSASATGGAIPAFAASVTGPTRVSLNLPQDGGIQISKAADFTFTWSGGTAGQAVVISIIKGTAMSKSILCAFSATAGTGTIPTALLSQLDVGNNQFSGSVVSQVAVDAGNNDVYLLAELMFWLTGSIVN